MIKYLVKGQNIETLEHEIIAADQIAFVKIHFVFDNSWKPLHKVVQLSQDEFTYNRVLGFDDTSCLLPAELTPGAVKMSLFGYDASASATIRATTVVKTLHIRPSGFDGESGSPIPPTPDLYQQLLQKISEKGGNGKSAYEIAVDNGYIGTEAEWLESLHGRDGETPDLSEYAKTAAVNAMLAPVAEKAHTHSNRATLNALTPELLTELQGLQQFEDSTIYDIQTINEALLTLNAQRHTHHNMTTLNGITDSHVERWELAYTSAMNLNERVGVNEGVFERFKTEILYDMQGCRTSISDILNRLSAVETELSGVETALAAIVEVTT